MLRISAGQGIDINAQNLNINYLFNDHRLSFGLAFNAINYSPVSPFSKENTGANNKTMLAGGLLANYRLFTTRNFELSGTFSAFLGGDGSDYIYYPQLDFKQAFYLSDKTRLFVGEGLNYFFMKSYPAKFYTQLFVGIAYNLR